MMIQPNSQASTAEEVPGVVEPPIECEICGQWTASGAEWHTISNDTDDLGDCDDPTDEPETQGYWLCQLCHRTCHDIMAGHTGDHRSFYAVVELIDRLAAPIRKHPRSYLRNPMASS